MSDNDFKINPDDVNRPRRSHKPAPRRHVYPDAVDSETDETRQIPMEIDLEEVAAGLENRAPKQGKKTPNKKNSHQAERRRPVPVSQEEEKEPVLVNILMDRRVSLWLGLLSVVLGLVIFIILFSYIKSDSLHQAVMMNLSPDEMVTAGIKAENLLGPVGSWLGYIIFAKAFGVGAFFIGIYFIMLGGYLLTGREFNFWKLTFRCTFLTIATSIIVGLVTFTMESATYWGGVHGHYVNQWLTTMTGLIGAIIVSLFLLGSLGAIYFNGLTRIYKKWKTGNEMRRQQKLEMRRRSKEKETEKEVDDTNKIQESASDAEPKANTPKKENNGADGLELVEPRPMKPIQNDKKDEEVIFSLDSPVDPNADSRKSDNGKETKTDDSNNEPAFEIDVPVNAVDKKSGNVAEKVVSGQNDYDPRADLSQFKFPTLDMLENRPIKTTTDRTEQEANKERIIKTLGNYGITIESIHATVGPTVTLFEIIPTEGIRISQIKRLEDDIALSLAAKGIRIIAPMPGRGTIGIEVPNNEPQIVSMRTILSSKKFFENKAKLPVALGATISNEIFVADLTSMPHALVAGATGQGKSVGLNVIISSLLYRKHPSELKFVMIDPKMVEFSVYERLRKHYLASLPGEEDAIVTDVSKSLNVLKSLCTEMDMRYALLRSAAVNKIEDYNRKFCERRLSMDKDHRYLPYIVVIIDEFADLIMTGGKEIEMPIMRITQKARAVGIHMIIATQRPSTNVLTGIIKANCPTRIAFRVQQNVDSRTILDRPGAEQLIGRGDMLYSQGGEMERVQCAFITSDEIETICNSIDAQVGYEHPYQLPEPVEDHTGMIGSGSIAAGGLDRDPLFDEAARFIVLNTTASTSSLQRRFEIGYNRAGKIMDQMEAAGIVGPASGSKPRSVLIDPEALERILGNK